MEESSAPRNPTHNMTENHQERTVTGYTVATIEDADVKSTVEEDVELGIDEEPSPMVLVPRPTRQRVRSKSLGSSVDDDFSYAFCMPQDASTTIKRKLVGDTTNPRIPSCLPRAESSTCTKKKPYNFVLDNYVEYNDNTKIPRLRGKDVDRIRAAIHNSHWAALCVAVALSCILTYSISNFAPNLRADVSQAVVICLVLATFPEVAASAGAGAFAGMAGTTAIPNYGWLMLLSAVVAAVWLTFHHFQMLVGCGGRLGTCAFIAMNLTVAIVAMPSGAVPWSLYGNLESLWSDRLEPVSSILAVVASTFISAAGGWARLRSKIPLNPVQAPTTIALVCMLIIEPTGYEHVGSIDAGLAVGSFVAMASKEYLPEVTDFAAAGFLAGFWILFLDPFFLEFGGKKGFTSFCGFISYVLIARLFGRARPRND